MTFAIAAALILAQDDHFPLKHKTRWTYATVRSEEKSTVVVRVDGTKKIGDQESVVIVRKDGDREETSESYAVTKDGVRQFGTGDATIDPPLLILKSAPKVGDAWTSRFKISTLEPEFGVEMSVDGEDDLEVPAGRYKALRVTSTQWIGDIRYTFRNWYAAGVGLIRYEQSENGRTILVGDLQSFEPGK